MKWCARVLTFSLVLSVSPFGAAEDDINYCENVPAPDISIFTELSEQALTLGPRLCKAMLGADDAHHAELSNAVERQLAEFIDFAEQAAQSDGLEEIDLSGQFAGLRSVTAANSITSKQLPRLSVEDVDYQTVHFPGVSGRVDWSGASCPPNGCLTTLRDYRDAFNSYQAPYRGTSAAIAAGHIDALNDEWSEFLDNARTQTSAGLILTTVMERDHFKKRHLVGPPERQWIALKPSLVYTSVERTIGGNDTGLGLSIEWVGVNWWNLPVPVGVSLASFYSDLESDDDLGHGLMFHVANRVSIGVAKHDGDTGMYFSLDLQRLFKNDKNRLEGFKARMGKVLGAR